MTSNQPLVTLFTAPKAFREPIGPLQERAVQSWMNLTPACEVLMFGDEEGIPEAATRYGARHFGYVARNEYGTPFVSSIFAEAQKAAKGRILCYINCDILLTRSFLDSLLEITFDRFLMVGQRWDLEPEHVPDYASGDWEAQLKAAVLRYGKVQDASGIDYFVHTRDLWPRIPDFALGRTMWDNWLIYDARLRRIPVVDASQRAFIVHQNHDYSHHVAGRQGVWSGPESQNNLRLAGGYGHALYTTDADWVLSSTGLRRPPLTVKRLARTLETYPAIHPGLRPRFLSWLVPRLFRAPRRLRSALSRSARRRDAASSG
jgi:hypothetical protein